MKKPKFKSLVEIPPEDYADKDYWDKHKESFELRSSTIVDNVRTAIKQSLRELDDGDQFVFEKMDSSRGLLRLGESITSVSVSRKHSGGWKMPNTGKHQVEVGRGTELRRQVYHEKNGVFNYAAIADRMIAVVRELTAEKAKWERRERESKLGGEAVIRVTEGIERIAGCPHRFWYEGGEFKLTLSIPVEKEILARKILLAIREVAHDSTK